MTWGLVNKAFPSRGCEWSVTLYSFGRKAGEKKFKIEIRRILLVSLILPLIVAQKRPRLRKRADMHKLKRCFSALLWHSLAPHCLFRSQDLLYSVAQSFTWTSTHEKNNCLWILCLCLDFPPFLDAPTLFHSSICNAYSKTRARRIIWSHRFSLFLPCIQPCFSMHQ